MREIGGQGWMRENNKKRTSKKSPEKQEGEGREADSGGRHAGKKGRGEFTRTGPTKLSEKTCTQSPYGTQRTRQKRGPCRKGKGEKKKKRNKKEL